MAQISKRFLKKEVEERILDLFWSALSFLGSKERTASFLDDLLTSTEKLMLAKRLSVVFMLLKGYERTDISEILKISEPTIWRIKSTLLYRGQGYKSVLERIMKEEKWEKFFLDLEHFFSQILPPAKGTNWKEVRKRQWENRHKEQKAF